MEHLPLPHDADLTKIPQVPYVCTKAYDGGSFLEYPLRLVLPRRNLLLDPMKDYSTWSSVIHSIPITELENIMQTWLLFGLTREILGEKYGSAAIQVRKGNVVQSSERHSFLARFTWKWLSPERKTCEEFVTTEGFVNACQEWISWIRARQSNSEYNEELYNSFNECFMHTYRVINAIRIHAVVTRGFTHPVRQFDKAVYNSIVSVAEALHFVVQQSLQLSSDREKFSRPAFVGTVDSTFSPSPVLHRGWCPSQTQIVNNRLHTFAMRFYVSTMNRASEVGKHTKCTESTCVELQSETEKYEVQHRCPCCRCDTKAPDSQQIALAFEQDTFPLIRLTDDPFPRIDVVPASPSTPYVSFSHIWADGLGNPNQNSLPECQLKYLTGLVIDLGKRMSDEGTLPAETELYTFIDTLTIPIGPRKLKAKALGKMRQIYGDATAVLILDKSITHYRFEDVDDYEALARLSTSNWMSRLWTLQEGLLSPNLWIQFRDRAVSIKLIRQRLQKPFKHFGKYSILTLDLMRQWVELNMESIHGPKIHPLVHIASSVWPRHCSVAEDEALCLATLLSIDVEAVANMAPEDRMQRMWIGLAQSSRGIPQEIILSECPKIQKNGFRWAPSSLRRMMGSELSLSESYDSEKSQEFTGHIVDGGLQVRYPGSRIHRPTALFQHSGLPSSALIHLKASNGHWYQALATRHMADAKTTSLTTSLTELVFTNAAGPVALVLATKPLSVLPSPTGNAIKFGVLGRCRDRNSNGHAIVQTDFLITFRLLDRREQRLTEAAESVCETVMNDPRLGKPSLVVDGVADLNVPENKAFGEDLMNKYIRPITATLIDTDSELAAIVGKPGGEGYGKLIGNIVMVLFGHYGMISDGLDTERIWIID